ncbi:Splicing factor 3B subunit 6-like protein [Hondaea fermentalgiana]|uniref:Splicing factor 3B subunit 6-like protein n=1 Tax=Hondaea fermentalgiana TaxID=2315210 RepID=A0A2R5GUV6_9STRA|nr:Splicing factor 3B subunit 6-like protein [Hondaea fermentalgiana]|eukprot:GBG32433.1 Splicing factor 3B subunit 6-like protein [Hondaea fermentalgiana]
MSASVVSSVARSRATRLPPEVSRILYVKNLPFQVTGDELYEIFGDYGAIRQIRIGNNKRTRGTAFVVYEDIFDAKKAVEKMTGFKVGERYLVVLYYRPPRSSVGEGKPANGDVGQGEGAEDRVKELKRKHRIAF